MKLRLKKSSDLKFKGFGKNQTGNHGIISNYNVGISDICNIINTKSIQNSRPISKNEKKREISYPISNSNNNKANDKNIKSSFIIQTINNFSHQPFSQNVENDKKTQTIIINTKDRFKNRIIDFNKEEEDSDSLKITSRNNFNNNITRPSPTQTKKSIFTKTKDLLNKSLHEKFVLMDRSQHLNLKKNLIKFEKTRETFQERLVIKNNKNVLRNLLNKVGINALSFSIYFYYFRNVT